MAWSNLVIVGNQNPSGAGTSVLDGSKGYDHVTEVVERGTG